MFNLLKVDFEFKLLNMVVDVAFKLLILEFTVNTDRPEPIILPATFKVDQTVALVAIKLYELTSYNPELFILQFILLYISLELKK